MRRAYEHPDFDYLEAGIIVEENGEIKDLVGSFRPPKAALQGGWAKVYKKGRDNPSEARVSLSEYTTGRSTWNTKPCTMIRKVAIVQAIREAFPKDFAGMYV